MKKSKWGVFFYNIYLQAICSLGFYMDEDEFILYRKQKYFLTTASCYFDEMCGHIWKIKDTSPML